jgi:hypothetical protein
MRVESGSQNRRGVPRRAHPRRSRCLEPLLSCGRNRALEFPGLKRITSDALWYSLALPKDQAERAAAELKTMLATPPQSETNNVIIGHTSNLQEAANIWPKKEGGAAVFRADGHGAFALVGSIDPADFAKATE